MLLYKITTTTAEKESLKTELHKCQVKINNTQFLSIQYQQWYNERKQKLLEAKNRIDYPLMNKYYIDWLNPTEDGPVFYTLTDFKAFGITVAKATPYKE